MASDTSFGKAFDWRASAFSFNSAANTGNRLPPTRSPEQAEVRSTKNSRLTKPGNSRKLLPLAFASSLLPAMAFQTYSNPETARVEPQNRTGNPGEDLLSGNFNFNISIVSLPGYTLISSSPLITFQKESVMQRGEKLSGRSVSNATHRWFGKPMLLVGCTGLLVALAGLAMALHSGWLVNAAAQSSDTVWKVTSESARERQAGKALLQNKLVYSSNAILWNACQIRARLSNSLKMSYFIL